jgi:hypothetical protein
MTLRLALRSLATQPVRSLVLAGGFGTGIAAMAGLLGVGEVILEQSRSPALRGGGDVVVSGAGGELHNARYLIATVMRSDPFAGRTVVASPSRADTLYLVKPDGATHALRARGGIPSLERATGDPESSSVAAWRDAPDDRAWSDPEPGRVLRAMDRFHPIPDVPTRADSWAEWLYFNAKSEDGSRFYLSFIVGRRVADGMRRALVRLQLDRDGELVVFSSTHDVREAEVLASAPDLQIGNNRIQLDGARYRIHLELHEEPGAGAGPNEDRAPDLIGDLELDAASAGSLPPMTLRGSGGWVSGYVVPVLWAPISGRLVTDEGVVRFDGAAGYHDHNWGFWEGVTWQWGQVAHEEISLVFGRIRPPADAADPDRVPAFLIVTGPDGPLGYSAAVRISEIAEPGAEHPGGFEIAAAGPRLSIRIQADVEQVTRTPFRTGDDERAMTFLQFRSRYRVVGEVADREIEFEALGSAETFTGE